MNSRRMNRLEELGRVDAEKAYTKKGKRNLGAEKSRIVSELKSGGKAEKNPKHEQAERKSKIKKEYRKMGFGKMMDAGDFDFDKVSKMKSGGRVNNKTKPKKPLSGSMKKPKPGSQSYQFLQTQKPRPTTSKRGGGLATRGMGAAMQNGGRVMGKGQGRVMRKRPTFNISMKRS